MLYLQNKLKSMPFLCTLYVLFIFTGGLHHAAACISGDSVYRYLKFEGGTHRVQRIPEIGLSSRMQRIHTGTASVVVLPQSEKVCKNKTEVLSWASILAFACVILKAATELLLLFSWR